MTRVVLHIDTLRLRGDAGLGVAEREALVASFVQALQSALQAQLAEPGAAAQLAAQGHRERLRLAVAPAAASVVAASASGTGATPRAGPLGPAAQGSADWGARAATSLCSGLVR